MAKEILCGFGVDVDAVAGWLGSYGGEDSPDDISRRLYRRGRQSAPVEAVREVRHQDDLVHPRPLDRDVPRQMQAVAQAGHEIGIHGYSHENPIAMTREQEMAVLDKCIELVTTLVGPPPDRLCRAVVGVLDGHQRAADGARHQVRPFADASRSPAI